MYRGRHRQSSNKFDFTAKREEVAEMALSVIRNSPSAIRRHVKEKLVIANNFVEKINQVSCEGKRPGINFAHINYSMEGEQYSFFDQVMYLGCTSIKNPKSECDIQSAMHELNQQSSELTGFINVTVAIPYTSDGDVRLFDANSIGQSSSCLGRFPISRILFCARGRQEPFDQDKSCFAFTCAHELESGPSDVRELCGMEMNSAQVSTEHSSRRPCVTFACHIFKCRSFDTVGKILLCFATAFKVQQRERKQLEDVSSLVFSSGRNIVNDHSTVVTECDVQVDFEFDVFLEIKEDDDRGSYVLSPQERNCFKLRRDREKCLQVALQQVAGPKILHVQKCFGLLLAAGRNVKHSDMHLLDVKNMGTGNDERTYLIEADWNPNLEQFEVLNTETPKDTRVYMTVAADVVFAGIQEPVRFSVECKARIYHEHERFWYVTRRALVERYFLSVRRTVVSEEKPLSSVVDTDGQPCFSASRPLFEVANCESATERDRRSRRLSSDRSPSKMPANLVAPPDDDDTDSDEPLLSGSGGDALGPCSSETMADWQICLDVWTLDKPSNVNVNHSSSSDNIANRNSGISKLPDETCATSTLDETQSTRDHSMLKADAEKVPAESPQGIQQFGKHMLSTTDGIRPLQPCDNGTIAKDLLPNKTDTYGKLSVHEESSKICDHGVLMTKDDQDSGASYDNRPSSSVAVPNSDGKIARRRPKQVHALIVRKGVPDALRGRVWQLLAGCHGDAKMVDTYRLLLSKECPNEQVITRDIHRTFPAHEYFKDAGGIGQEALYRISKAYSLYDEDVGYCQGLSFLAASLLLHIPEEQAFCVLVRIMFDYGLRDLFKKGFEALHLRFYQLERLIEDYIPDLHQHFEKINVETHMYASQWFLTLFTAKFTLSVVFRIIDLFLCEGMHTIFHVSVALLKAWKRQLMELDFEGALKYFRVILPRKYRTEHEAQELIQQAVKLKISHKRLSKYEKEYIAMKNREVETQDPVERLEKECAKLRDSMMRLERENDDLAHELVTSKIELRKNLDAADDNIESLQAQLEKLTAYCRELEDYNKRLLLESEQVKEMCRREMQRMDEENNKCSSIISNYKQVCSDLGNHLDGERTRHTEELNKLRAWERSFRGMVLLRNCPTCSHSESVDKLLVISPRLDNSPRLAKSAQTFNGCIEPLDFEQQQQTRRLELELVRTKLNLVESECKNQDLCHQLAALQHSQSQQDHSNNNHASGINRSGRWLKKTLTSLKDATKSTGSAPIQPVGQESTGFFSTHTHH